MPDRRSYTVKISPYAYFILNTVGVMERCAPWLRAVFGTWKQFECYTCTRLWQKKGQSSVDVKPYPFDVQNRIVVTLIKNVEKHDLNWLAAFFDGVLSVNVFLHHIELNLAQPSPKPNKCVSIDVRGIRMLNEKLYDFIADLTKFAGKDIILEDVTHIVIKRRANMTQPVIRGFSCPTSTCWLYLTLALHA